MHCPPIWTRGDHFRFVTLRPGSITRGRVFTVTNDICRSGEFVFHPALSRLGFDLEGTVLVWDAPNTRFLLNFVCGDSPAEISFSSDSRFSARQDAKEDICIWRDSPTDYVLHQKLVPHVWCASLSHHNFVTAAKSGRRAWWALKPPLAASVAPLLESGHPRMGRKTGNLASFRVFVTILQWLVCPLNRGNEIQVSQRGIRGSGIST